LTIRAFKKQGFFLSKTLKTLQNFFFECDLGYISHRNVVFRTIMLNNSISTSILVFSMLFYMYEGVSYDTKAIGIAFSYSILLSRHLIDAICSTINLETELLSLQRLTSLENYSKKTLEYAEKTNLEDFYNENREEIEETSKFKGRNEEKLKKNAENSEFLLIFHDISLRYGDTYALKSISFRIKPLEKVAFCGRTGSGKSSIFSLFLKFYSYQKGEIFFENKGLSLWNTKELRKKIAIIPQNGFLYKGTLKENLDPAGLFSKDKLWGIIGKFGLLDVFQGKGLEFIVEKDGGNLSNGEKQMVNFLQNVICDKPIILLDEATSNLDEKLGFN